MPREARLLVRTVLVGFDLSVLLGAGLVAARHLGGRSVPWPLVVVQTHLAVVGDPKGGLSVAIRRGGRTLLLGPGRD